MWQDSFPPLAHPIQLIGWFLGEHTGSMLAYPVGGPKGGSTAAFLCCAAGLIVLARRRQGWLLALLLLPLGLNFVAAAMHRYPYPQHMKFGLYFGGDLLRLDGRGHCGRARLARPARQAFQFAGDADLVDGSCPGRRRIDRPRFDLSVQVGHDVAGQGFRPLVLVRLGHDSELVCLETDWKKDLSPGTYTWGWSSLYLCNQRIYSPRHARGEPPHLERVSAERPLRCVLFRALDQETDGGRVDRWLAECSDPTSWSAGTAIPCRFMGSGAPRRHRTTTTSRCSNSCRWRGSGFRSPLPPGEG